MAEGRPCTTTYAYNEAERLNGIETKSVRKSCLKDVVFLPSDEDLSGESAIAARRRRFQYVLAQSISGGVYAGQNVRSLVSHPGIEHSETYDNEFRLYCRVILDGKQADVPIHARSTIANALHYRTLHHAQGYYHFQLRRTSCMRTLGKPCTPEDYPFAVAFKTCSELSLDAKLVSPFLDDATVGPDGQFLNPDGLAAKRVELGVHVITNPPPSVFCVLRLGSTNSSRAG